MKLGDWVWRDGEWVKWEDATVHVSAHALHYGSSVFEGIRAYQTDKGTAILRLRPHTQRLVNSCKIARIGLELTAEDLDNAILETVRRNAHPACNGGLLDNYTSGILGEASEYTIVHELGHIFDYITGNIVGNNIEGGLSLWRDDLEPKQSSTGVLEQNVPE